MSYVAVEDAEVDLGVKYAREKLHCHVTRRNLYKIGDRFLMIRYLDRLSFGEALRATMDYFKLKDERRERYKAVLGKMFGSRNKRKPKKVTRRPKAARSRPIKAEGSNALTPEI